MQFAVLGLGEAGSRFANDLIALGHTVAGWDPQPRRELDQQFVLATSNADAVSNAEIVFSANLPEVSESIAREVSQTLLPGAFYCEMNTSEPQMKQRIETILQGQPVNVIDLAIMAPVPPKGIASPMLASGPEAANLAQRLSPFMNIKSLNRTIGDAAGRKLMRSIVYKGVAAVVCEAMEAADKANLSDYMREQIATIIGDQHELVDRFLTGSKTHALRRSHEMQAVSNMLRDMQCSDLMTVASLQNLQRYIQTD